MMAAAGGITRRTPDPRRHWLAGVMLSALMIAIAAGLGIAIASSRHSRASAGAASSTAAPLPSPAIQSVRAGQACSSYTAVFGAGSYLVGAFDSDAEKLTAWGRR